MSRDLVLTVSVSCSVYSYSWTPDVVDHSWSSMLMPRKPWELEPRDEPRDVFRTDSRLNCSINQMLRIDTIPAKTNAYNLLRL